MKDINAAEVPKFDHLIGVSYDAEMSPEVQNTFQNNTAYQAYSWVPALVQSQELGTGTYWFNLNLPNCKVELAIMSLYDYATSHINFFNAYRGDTEILRDDGLTTVTMPYGYFEEFYRYPDDNDYAHILPINKVTQVRLSLSPKTNNVVAFTAFYRIVGN